MEGLQEKNAAATEIYSVTARADQSSSQPSLFLLVILHFDYTF